MYFPLIWRGFDQATVQIRWAQKRWVELIDSPADRIHADRQPPGLIYRTATHAGMVKIGSSVEFLHSSWMLGFFDNCLTETADNRYSGHGYNPPPLCSL